MSSIPTPDEALALLQAGNQRYVTGEQTDPRRSAEERQTLAGGQSPFAVILGCADSRVPPNLIFDQGLGDLFVIRVAGNIAADAAVGSIEYAVGMLQTPLVMVLGHSSCGAVQAAVAGQKATGRLPGLIKAIQPAVDQVREAEGDLLDNAVKANARHVAEQLRASEPVLAESVQAGRAKVVAAYYDLVSGEVTVLD